MNTPELHFLGWDKPAIKLVATKLLNHLENEETAAQYRRATVVVPTAESGRRLREYMAENAKNKALLLPRIILAGQLISVKGDNIATEEETLAAWLQVLGDENSNPVDMYAPLIPRRPNTHQERWTVGVAHKLMALRSRLEQEEVSINKVTHLLQTQEEALDTELSRAAAQSDRLRKSLVARKAIVSKEQVRWRKLGEVFSAVDACIRRNSPRILTRSEAISKEINNPLNIWQGSLIIITCLPELSPQLERYLLNLIEKRACDVQIWMNIPKEEAVHFDSMGRPKEGVWSNRDIDIPQAASTNGTEPCQSTIHLLNDAASMAEKARELAGGFDSDNVVIVTGNTDYTPALISAFAENSKWQYKSPEGRSLQTTSIGQLPDLLADYCSARQDFFSNATNNAGMIESNAFVALLTNGALQQILGVCPEIQATLQRHIEHIREILLPASVERLCHYLHPDTILPENDYREFAELAKKRNIKYYEFACKAADFAQDFCNSKKLPDQLGFLAKKLSAHFVDGPLRKAASCLSKTIKLLTSRIFSSHIKNPVLILELLRYMARNSSVSLQLTDGDTLYSGDILGWRELTFAQGRRVIIAAMHDGCIPEPVQEDDFLPESLCKELGIRNEIFRTARDSYLLTALLHSRKAGDVHFLLARQNPDGTPTAPSTLLLRCETELPQRARLLFAESSVVSEQPLVPLCPLRVAEKGPEQNGKISPGMLENISQLSAPVANPFADKTRTYSPSSLSGFLQCPLSFWLNHLFGLDAGCTYDDDKSELESNEYGTLMHAVLQHVVEAVPSLEKLEALFPKAADTQTLTAHLTQYALKTAADEWSKVYMTGSARNTQPLPLEIQLRNIEKTLQDFAWRHVLDLQAGWCNICCERKLKPTLTLTNGETARFSMIADRIDYNAKTRRWRIIDYKTSPDDKKPLKVHFDEVKNGEHSPFFRFMNSEEYPYPLVSAKFGSNGDITKYYRWKDVQLMLYTFGLRKLNAAELSPELPDESLADVMPDLFYYNLQSKTQQMECFPLIEDGKLTQIPGRGKQIGHFCLSPEEMLASALQTVDSAIRMIRAGVCLFSAEALQLKNRPFSKLSDATYDKNAPRFGAISQQSDPRSMFALPQLNI